MTTNESAWNISDLMQQLEQIYKEKKDAYAWQKEKASVQMQLEALSSYLGNYYSGPNAIARGGSGILLKVFTKRLHNQPRVIKFPRPLPDNAPEFATLLNNEIRLLSEISSRSIVVIHEAGQAPVLDSKQVAGLNDVPFYVMDYIEGDNSNSFIEKNQIPFSAFLSIIQETIEAIASLHQKGIVHLDIKPGNIVIDKSAHPILLDLGTTKKIMDDSSETKFAGTFRYMPVQQKQYLHQNSSDPSRSEGTIKRSEIKLTWDLHSFGLTLREWIFLYMIKNAQQITLYQRKYLLLVALRMSQDPYDDLSISEYGLQHNFLEQIRYKTIQQPLSDIKKITLGNVLADIIPELDINHYKTIQGGSLEATTFTERLAKTLDHPTMRRLGEISQLGIVQLVYPTCTHTRLEHSLGTYHNVIKYIRSLYYDPLNPVFRQIMEPEHIRAALLAALLHDVGQFPLAHDLEDIDSKLFNHTGLGRGFLTGERDLKVKGSKKLVFQSLEEIYKLWDVRQDMVLSILQAKINQPSHNIIYRILKSLISGPIDADKLDYLIRDAQRLQVPYSNGIDIARLLRCLTLVIKDHANDVHAYIGVHEKGRIPAEFVTLSRYAMFTQVYWHHAVRSGKAMLSRAIFALLSSFNSEEERNIFQNQFESFVAFGSSQRRHVQLSMLLDATTAQIEKKADSEAFKNPSSGSVLNPWDLSVILFLKAELEKRELVESELLDDLIERKLYKRLFNFSKENDSTVWNGFTEQWSPLNAFKKNQILTQIEKAIIISAGNRLSSNPDTVFLTKQEIESMEFRVGSYRPLILIDIPSERPGSTLSLQYVMEEDRRELRKSNRICGKCLSDPVWEEYANKMREKAGRIRVFAHPDYIDSILSAVDKKWMGEILGDLSAFEEKQ